jgi:hypothetical protein
MTEEKAKEVLRRSGPPENVAEHIEALHVALRVLGDDVSMKEIWKWAEGGVQRKRESDIIK